MKISLLTDRASFPRLRARAAVDGLLLRRGSCTRAHRPKHIRREGFPFFFMFRPRPTHHATARLRCCRIAPCAGGAISTRCGSRAPSWRHCFCRPAGATWRFNAAKTAPPLPTLPSPVGSFVAAARFPRPCAVTSLAAGVRIVRARLSRASAAPAPQGNTPTCLVADIVPAVSSSTHSRERGSVGFL